MNLKFYTSVANGLKLKVRKFWTLTPTVVEVTGEKLVGDRDLFGYPILNRVKGTLFVFCKTFSVGIIMFF